MGPNVHHLACHHLASPFHLRPVEPPHAGRSLPKRVSDLPSAMPSLTHRRCRQTARPILRTPSRPFGTRPSTSPISSHLPPSYSPPHAQAPPVRRGRCPLVSHARATSHVPDRPPTPAPAPSCHPYPTEVGSARPLERVALSRAVTLPVSTARHASAPSAASPTPARREVEFWKLDLLFFLLVRE